MEDMANRIREEEITGEGLKDCIGRVRQ